MSLVIEAVIVGIYLMYFVILLNYHLAWKEVGSAISGNTDEHPFISVIVPVRNEEQTITTMLDYLNRQRYQADRFEIIIVNDHSNDGTMEKVYLYIKEYPLLNIVPASLSVSASKKMAISAGVSLAKGELIVTTDADCWRSDSWLTELAAYYMKFHPVMIISPVMLENPETFLERFQQLDYLALQTAGLAAVGTAYPILCSGANLAFKRQAFLDVNGYENNETIISGDDVFLMFKMKKKFPKGVHSFINKNAIVYTHPIGSAREFIRQRHRWGSKVRHYQNKYVAFIGIIIMLANLSLLFSLAGIYFGYCSPLFTVSVFLLKGIIDFIFLAKGARFFSVKLSLLDFLLMELFYPFYYLWLILYELGGENEWKGRKVSG